MLKYRRPFIALLHVGLTAGANAAAFWLRFDGSIPSGYLALWWAQLPWLLGIQAAAFVPFRLYDSLWRYTGLREVAQIVGAVALGSALFLAEIWAGGLVGVYPTSVLIMSAILLGGAIVVIRVVPRAWSELTAPWRGRRVLIVGAGNAGSTIVREMKHTRHYRPVGFIDDDESKWGTRIHGVRVLGGPHDLARILAETDAEEALVSIPRADPATVRKLVSAFQPFKIPLRTLPYLRETFDRRLGTHQIRNLSIDDLMPRVPVGADLAQNDMPRRLLKGRRVLVTGAGGSIGSELCRQIAAFGPSVLVLFERYENSLFDLANTLADSGASSIVRQVVGDVTDERRVDAVLDEYRPEVVFHAAAHKHVPLMELNPCEAIKNNVRGTRVMAEAAVRHGVDRFVLVSTDKAVNPISVMGAAKRLAEMIVQDLATRSDTVFLAVRFGNVLGSNGSVVPTFVKQVEAGGPVTVTHPKVRRYFMLIEEAVQLMLHAAVGEESGRVYVLNMGEPICLLDLARNVIRLCGFIPDEEIPIKFVGLRPGEKLSEDLVEADEIVEPSHAPNVLRLRSTQRVKTVWLQQHVTILEALASRNQADEVIREFGRILPTFRQAAGPAAAGAAWLVAPETGARPAASEPASGTLVARTAACLHCGRQGLHRSRARSTVEWLQKRLRRTDLCRCPTCGWRGWVTVAAGPEPEWTSAKPASVDLASLERAGLRPSTDFEHEEEEPVLARVHAGAPR